MLADALLAGAVDAPVVDRLKAQVVALRQREQLVQAAGQEEPKAEKCW